jgi:hypothetical protein
METHCPSNDITTEDSRNSRPLSKKQWCKLHIPCSL